MVAMAQIEVVPKRWLQRDLVGGGGFNDVAAAPAAFLPPHPTAQIEARVGRAIIFLFSYGMDTFRRPAHADKSCEGFIGANGKCVIFVGKFLSARG
jgi:hypothetical protein